MRAYADHREIWTEFYKQPHLANVLNPAIQENRAVTEKEKIFVTLIVLHLSGMYHAIHERLLKKPEGMEKDIAEFFSLPVPLEVWKTVKGFQDRDFVAFIETCLNSPERRQQ